MYQKQLDAIDAQYRQGQVEYSQHMARFMEDHCKVMRSRYYQGVVLDEEKLRQLEAVHYSEVKQLTDTNEKANKELWKQRSIIQAAANLVLVRPVDWKSTIAQASSRVAQECERVAMKENASRERKVAWITAEL